MVLGTYGGFGSRVALGWLGIPFLLVENLGEGFMPLRVLDKVIFSLPFFSPRWWIFRVGLFREEWRRGLLRVFMWGRMSHLPCDDA